MLIPKNIVIQEHIKLKENAVEASSKMFIEKEKELNSRIEELETELNKRSLNSLEVKRTNLLKRIKIAFQIPSKQHNITLWFCKQTGESLQGPEAGIALQNREVLSSNKRYVHEPIQTEKTTDHF